MVGDLEDPHRLACLPRQGKSHPDTGRSLQSCIFIVQESGEGIVRLSEHPLIQDSLVAPEPGFNDDESGAQIVFGIARRVPPPSSSRRLQTPKIVSGSAKHVSTYYHIENNINTNQIC